MTVGTIWVVVDRQGESVAPVCLELVSKAAELAGSVEAVTWGDAEVIAAEVGAYGAAALHTVGDLAGGLPGPAVSAALAARIAAGPVPDAVILPHNYDGRDIAARLSAKIDRPVLTNVVGLSLAGDGGEAASDGGEAAGDGVSTLVAQHTIFGGTEVLEARFTAAGPGIFVVRAKSFPAQERGGGPARVDRWEVPELGASGAARIVARHIQQSEGPKLDEASVVVSGGRGLGDAEGYQMVERLAELLHGAPGASRAIVDAGWVPYSHQVGQTGKTVKPDVYIAVGISGATQHMVGMKGAKNIIAINKDSEAPIFSIADLGVVGDAKKVLPRLIEALEAR